ncbi:hypothetical protein [Streptomyces noursei]
MQAIRPALPSTPTVWVATPNGITIIDTIAVARVLAGAPANLLTKDEAHYTAALMLDHGHPHTTVAERLRISHATLRKWHPDRLPPTRSTRRTKVVCGTIGGYSKHRRTGTPPCPRCKTAYRAAERHYHHTGTYVGAPEFREDEAA